MQLTHPVCKCVAGVWGVVCRVSRRGETSRMNVGELKCNYQAITVEERLGGEESYSFSGALI